MNRENDCREDFRAKEHNTFPPKLLSAELEIQSQDTWYLQGGN